MSVTMAPAPPRSRDQRMEALALANRIRLERAQLKRDVKGGRVALVPVLLDPPWWLLTAKVFDLLLAAPKIGRVRAGGMLNRCHVSPSKTLGGMTPRQRAELVGVLRRRGVR